MKLLSGTTRIQKSLIWLSSFLSGLIPAIYVLSLKDLVWHPARSEELNATFQAFKDTGILLIKPNGSGSYGAQAPGNEQYVLAGWDDDPGSYLLASLLGQIIPSESPYPGLRLFMTFIVFVTGALLPLLMFRLFRTPIAAYASVLLPFVNYIITGSPLIGLQYGKFDSISTLPTYALYGIAGALVFLGLIALIWIGTLKLSTSSMILISLFMTVFAGVTNLFRSNAGIAIALGVGVLWFLRLRNKKGLGIGALIALLSIVLSLGVQNGIMYPVNSVRAEITGQSASELPDSHGTWHALYLGLSWPQPITDKKSEFDITWSDEFGWDKARVVNPDIIIASTEYDLTMRTLYFEELLDKPLSAIQLYVEKTMHTLLKYSSQIIFIFISALLIWRTRQKHIMESIKLSSSLAIPTIMWGLIPAVMVMPLIYFFNELEAGIGMLVAIYFCGVVAAYAPQITRFLAKDDLSRNADH